MAQFEPYKGEIERHGSLAYIAAEKRNGLFKPEAFLQKRPVSFPFLLDEDRAVTKSYGVYKAMGIDSFNIARPATFVVDSDGKIAYIFVGDSQMDRAPIAVVVDCLHDLGRRRAAHQT